MGESSISNIGGSRRQGYHNPVDSILMQDRPDVDRLSPRLHDMIDHDSLIHD